MTLEEFSIEFDILYNNISSNQAPGLTEYEKSVFLTQAQEALVLDLYKGVTGDSFETTEEVTRYLSSLVVSKDNIKLNTDEIITSGITRYYTSLPEDVMFITYQSALYDGNDIIVIPSKQEFLNKDLRNPFRGPSKNRMIYASEGDKLYYYIGKNTDYNKYNICIKYLKTPSPIILNPDDGFTINNHPNEKDGNREFTCELPESLHRNILTRAVQLAKAVWQS